jgi:hypothetical protein
LIFRGASDSAKLLSFARGIAPPSPRSVEVAPQRRSLQKRLARPQRGKALSIDCSAGATEPEEHSLSPSGLAQPWVAIVGALIGVLTLVFLMILVLLGVFGHEVPCNSTYLVNSVLSFGAALSAGFLGGNASARGNLDVPLLKNAPLTIGLTGGVAALAVMLILTSSLFGKSNCQQTITDDQNWKRDYALMTQKMKVEVVANPGTPNAFDVEDREDLLSRLNRLSLIGNTQLQADRDKLVSLVVSGPVWNELNPWSVRYSPEMKNEYNALRTHVRSIAVTKGVDVEKVEQIYAPEAKRIFDTN